MNFVKALAKLAIIAVIIFVAILLINTFMPNPYTAAIFTFVTVTAPAYLTSKLEWVTLSIGGIITAAGAAIRSINKTKDEAQQAVTSAQIEANQAKNLASGTFNELSDVKNENLQLKQQIADMNATRTEAEQLVSQQQAEIANLKREKQEFKELAEKKIGATEVRYK
jgi:chromosome segregation ATPase